MKRILIAAIAISTLGLTACSFGPTRPGDIARKEVIRQNAEVINSMPEWYLEDQEDDGMYSYTAGTGVSSDAAMAFSKAKLDAQAKLAERINTDIDLYMKSHSSDINGQTHESTQRLVRKVVDQVSLNNSAVVKRLILQEGTKFRVYLQMRYPTEVIQQAMNRESKAELARQKKMEDELDARQARKNG